MDSNQQNDIRVTKREGAPAIARLEGARKTPWGALLGLVALGIVGLLAWQYWDRRDSSAADGVVGTSGRADVIDDLGDLGTGDQSAHIGKRAELENVRVSSVTGDRSFWVHESEGQSPRLLVLLSENQGGQRETELRVREGQRLRLEGTLRAAADVPKAAGGDARELTQARVFLLADRVTPHK